jgi:hypothetical protein
LNFVPATEPEKKKTIYLKGFSGRQKSGYSIEIDNSNQMMLLDPKQNILGDSYTIEFWFKPEGIDKSDLTVLNNENGSNHKFSVNLSHDSCITVVMNSRKAEDILNSIKSNSKINFNEWNYIALSVTSDKLQLILNESISELITQSDIIKSVSDRIYFGNGKGPEKRNREDSKKIINKYSITEFAIWKKELSPEYLMKNRLIKKTGDEKDLILYYDFAEANWETAFDLTKNDYWSVLFGGIKRKLDSPLNTEAEKKLLNKNLNTVLRLNEKGLMLSTKDLFGKPSSFTIQADARFNIKKDNDVTFYFEISQPEIIFRNYIYKKYIELENTYRITNIGKTSKRNFDGQNKWHRYSLCYSYEEDYIKFYIDGDEFLSLDSLKSKYDISRWFYGISFGGMHFFYAPRFFHPEIFLDNIKIFDRVIGQAEIYSESKNGLLANWTFEKSDRELVFDEVNNLPAILFENFELMNEEVK